MEGHLDLLNQSTIFIIARIFKLFLSQFNLMEDGNKFIRKVRWILQKYQFYEMNEFFICILKCNYIYIKMTCIKFTYFNALKI